MTSLIPTLIAPQQYTHVLVFPVTSTHICLGYKKRGHGDHYWNGFGGKVEAGETIHASAVRELREESGLQIKPADLVQVADLSFVYQDSVVYGGIFTVDTWQGTILETEEMKPQWFLKNDIPYENMWRSDRLWLPQVLNGKKLVGTVVIDAADRRVKESAFKEVRSLE